ncbi:hypothetical protein ABPG75_009138 [Micractinium tetrahymenae]
MASRIVMLALLGCFALAHAYEGDGTAYSAAYDKDATGFNACGFGKLSDRFEKYYGAMNRAQFGGSCGKCVRVRGTESGATGKELVVMIVDECPECKHGDIDFSTEALQAITGFSWDRKGISWDWTSCDDEGSSTSSDGEQKGDSSSNSDSDNNSDSSDSKNREKSDKSDSNDSSDSKDEASGEPEKTGTYRKWVVDCDDGRKRCWNLVLASQGYQCMNKRKDSCCLKHNGKICVKVDSVDDSEDVEWEDDKPSKPSNSRRLLRMR